MVVLLRRAPLLLLIAAGAVLASCSNQPEPIVEPLPRPYATTSTTAVDTSETSAAAPATVSATYGCGPADGPQITISGRNLGTGHVVAEVLYDGTVTDRSAPMAGPSAGTVVEPRLPSEAYDAGIAQVRFVTAEAPGNTIVQADLVLELAGGCG